MMTLRFFRNKTTRGWYTEIRLLDGQRLLQRDQRLQVRVLPQGLKGNGRYRWKRSSASPPVPVQLLQYPFDSQDSTPSYNVIGIGNDPLQVIRFLGNGRIIYHFRGQVEQFRASVLMEN